MDRERTCEWLNMRSERIIKSNWFSLDDEEDDVGLRDERRGSAFVPHTYPFRKIRRKIRKK